MKNVSFYCKVAIAMVVSLLSTKAYYSQCVVTNTGTNIATAGTLKWAVNGCPAGGTITFNIPGAGPHTIPVVAGPWPDGPIGIDKQLNIQGPNLNGDEIILDGGGTADAFSVGWWDGAPAPGADGSSISGLTIINCVNGISIGPVMSDNVTIDDVHIGITRTGITGAGYTNSGNGIVAVGDDQTNAQFQAGGPFNPFIGINNLSVTNSVISGNDNNGIQYISVTGGTIDNNIIGPDISGTSCIATGGAFEEASGGGNGYDGIQLQNSSTITVSSNVLSCNGHGENAASFNGKRGLYIEGSDDNIVVGNFIGTDITGMVALPNYKSGILISQGSDNNTIGGTNAADRNIISGNGLNTASYSAIPDKHGIVIDDGGLNIPSTNNNIWGNYIGLDATGDPLGNSKNGVEIIGDGQFNNIGGATAAHGNVISGNGASGISIAMGSSDNNIQNNFIGTDINGCNTVAGTGNVEQGIILSSGDATFPAGIAPLAGNQITDNIIGNSVNGIQTYGDEVIDGIIIQDNSIGVDACNGDIGNTESGILIQTTLTDILIGGTLTNGANVIGNNDQNGITIDVPSSSGTNNVISGNFLGVLSDGTTQAANDGTGISIGGLAQNITIGGTGVDEGNIIAGNGGTGILITAFNGTGFAIEGNNIGVDQFGGVLGNGPGSGTGYGIQVDSATVVIGGSAAAANTIVGNESGGILINTFATQVTVSQNVIGDPGTASLGNAITVNGGTANVIDNQDIQNYAGNGIDISGGTTDVTNNNIFNHGTSGVSLSGGTAGNNIGTAGNGNTIYDNTNHGINIDGAANNNGVYGNEIGLAGANGMNGININGADANTIGGCNVGEFNVIVNHTGGNSGIFMTGAATTDNVVDGNFIGVDATSTPFPNGIGVTIENSASNNDVGTTCGNTISGNTGDGVFINDADDNNLNSNRIGTNAGGTAAVANGSHGVNIIFGSTGNSVGSGTGSGNLISGNVVHGVNLDDSPSNFVYGNYVGTNITGTAAIANGQSGISVTNGSSFNTIGGATANQANLTSGNTEFGISIDNADQNIITGNGVGLDATLTGTIPNGLSGIGLTSADQNTIGAVGAPNLVGGNTQHGIVLTGSINNTIQANIIGNTGLGNTLDGINLSFGSRSNQIGGTGAGEGNTIAHNGSNGINIVDAGSLDNPIRQNSMFCNTLRGIEENGIGNEDYANPVASIGIESGSSPSVFCNPAGTYPANAIIEVFYKGACKACGSDDVQGMTYVGSGTVAADGSVSFNVGITVPEADSNNYIITVTEPAGGLVSTSEFSTCSYWKGCTPPDVTITAQGPIPFCEGGSVDLHATFNSGSDFTWYIDGVLQSGPTLDDSIFTATAPGDYTVLVETPDGCDSLSDPLTVTIDSLPTPASAGPDQTICEDSLPTILSANTPSIGTGVWSVSSGTATVDTPGSPTSTVSGMTGGTSATLVWTISNGVCPDETDDVDINIDALPTAAVAGTNDTICETALPYALSGNTPVVGTGVWTLGSGTGTPDTPGSPTSTVSGITAGTSSTFIWTISNGVCPDETDDVVIMVDQSPSVADAGPNQNVCASSANLAAVAPLVGTGTWSVVSGSGSFSPDVNTANATVSGLSVGLNEFQWEVSNGVCPSTTDIVEIDQAGTLTTPDAGPNDTICITAPNVTMAANAVAGGETGTWSVEAGSGTFADPNDPTTTVTGFGVGVNTYRWTISDGLCTPAFDEMNVVVDDTPDAATAGIDQTICEDSLPTILSANTPAVGTGIWSVSSGTATVDTPGSPTSTVSGMTGGTSATLVWTISNGVCPDETDDVDINVDVLPSAAVAGTNDTICETALPHALSGNTPAVGTGMWTLGSGTGTPDTPASPTSTVSGITAGTSSTFIWTISNGVCPDETDDVVVMVDATPDPASAGTDDVICITDLPTSVTGNTPTTGTGMWSVGTGSATLGTPGSATTSVDAIAAGSSATLIWTISNGVCPDETDDVMITVEDAPTTADAGTDQNPCTASSTLGANTPTVGTGTWTSLAGTATVTTANDPSSPITGLVEGELNQLEWCISTGGVCPQSCDVVEYTRQNNPTTSIAIDPVSTICEGSNLSFTTTYSNEGAAPTFEWFVQNVSVQGPDGTDNYSTTALTPGDSVFVVITGNDPCVTDNIDTAVIYPNIDAAVTADAGTGIATCGDTATLQAVAPVLGSGSWSLNGASTATFTSITPINSENGFVSGISPVGSPLILDWTVTNGTCSDVDQVTVTSSPIPNPSVSLSGTQEVCEGTSPGTFTATASDFGSGVTYQWYENGVAVGTNSTTYTSGSFATSGNVSVAITSTDACGAGLGDSTGLGVTVVLEPIDNITGDASFCSGNTASLQVTDGTADSYQWFLGGSPVQTGSSITVGTAGDYTVTATNTGTGGTSCPITAGPFTVAEIVLTVNAGPDDEVILGEGETTIDYTLQGSTNGTPLWSPSANLSDANITTPVATLSLGTNTFVLSASAGGCFDSDDVTIIVRGPVWVPTAFSPGNDDGNNDYWVPQGLDGWEDWTVRVYNRWGSLVHEQEYDGNPFVPWDGIRNGEPMPVGTYYFVVDVPGAGTFTGPLTLMR